jgi:N-acetylmuramoyl-L-alanine amidase
MIVLGFYLLKVMICSGILFLYYHVALRNKLFHQWNRFYLLAAVLLSLAAPVVRIGTIHQTTAEPNKAIRLLEVIQSADGYMEEVAIGSQQSFSTGQWVSVVYASVSFIFLLAMIVSLMKLFTIIRSHSIKWVQGIKFINTDVPGTPFSFFHFIFWNKKIDLKTETGQQIFQHELVHIKEKHTVDKIFMQAILVLFWCNPFFWLIRRELKLIHEFIADKKAIGEQGTAALAAMILSSFYPAQFNSLTSQFFQTSIKRRLAMLKKIQNPRINYLSRVLALPILALTVLAFTLKTKKTEVPVIRLEKQITVVLDAGHGMGANGKYMGVQVDAISEDQIALALVTKIKELNTDDKLKIVLTRTSDGNVDLPERVNIARKNNADLFVSIHVNGTAPGQDPGLASGLSRKKGFEIYVSNKQPAYQLQSEVLGSVLQQELNSVYATNASLLKRATGVFVLDKNVCPSVLVECGFLTDKQDKEFITNGTNQDAVAKRILAAIGRYAAQQLTGKISKANSNNEKIILESDAIVFKSQGKEDALEKGLVIINGKKVDFASLENKTVSGKATIYKENDPEAIKLYGDDAKYGAMVFENATIKETKLKVNSTDTIPYQTYKGSTVKDLTVNPSSGKVYIKYRGGQTDSMSIEEAKKRFRLPPPPPGVKGEITITRDAIFQKTEKEATVDQAEWKNFLRKNMQPIIESASKKAPAGKYTVLTKFIVGKDGRLSDIKIMKDPGYGLGAKIAEMMKTSPTWTPAFQNGKPVNSYHTQPVTVVISNS